MIFLTAANGTTKKLMQRTGSDAQLRFFLFTFFVLYFAAATFAQDADPQFVLQKQIATGSIEEKREALFQIRNIRTAQASLLAVPALSDANEMVRATAASSVIFLPLDESAGLLVPLLNDKAEFVRREAAYALGITGSRRASGPLLQNLQKEKAPEVRAAIVAALGGIGDAGALEILTAILAKKPREEDEFIRRSAARSIGQIAQIIRSGKPSVVTPQNFLPGKFKDIETSADVGISVQFPAFLPAAAQLARVLKNSSEAGDTRREAAFALGAIGDKAALAVLTAHLKSNDPYLAEIAGEALLKIGRSGQIK